MVLIIVLIRYVRVKEDVTYDDTQEFRSNGGVELRSE